MQRARTPAQLFQARSLSRRLTVTTLAIIVAAIAGGAMLAGAALPHWGIGVTIAFLAGLAVLLLIPVICLALSLTRTVGEREDRVEDAARARTIISAITAIFAEKNGVAASRALLELLRDEFHAPFALLARTDTDGAMTCLRTDEADERKLSDAEIPSPWLAAIAAGQTSLSADTGLTVSPPQRAALIPIVAGNTALGLLVLPEPARSYTPSDAELLGELGQAVASAFLSQQRHQEQEYRKLRIIEDAYRLSEARLRAVFDESQDMILTTDAEGRIIDINEAGVRLLGQPTKEAIIGRFESEFWMNERDHAILMKEITDHGHVKDFEVILKREDNTTVFGLESAMIFRGTQGAVEEIHAMIKDITERIHDEQALWKMNIELAEANQKLKDSQTMIVQQEKLASIGQLAAGVAHEINNPLAFLMSNSTVVRRSITALKEFVHAMEASPAVEDVKRAKERHDIDYILKDFDAIMAESEDGFRRITDIVQNLKSFSRIESSERFEPFDINKGIETTLSVARNEVKYIAEVKLDLASLPLVECVGGEVNQVLLNLVMNAAQAIKSQGRTDKGTIEIRTGVRDDWVWIEIKDDGPGIPKGQQLRIFDAFYTTKPVGQGTGLGLSISSDIVVHRHGGKLTVESDTGKGACFRVELPVTHREAQPRPPEPLPPQ